MRVMLHAIRNYRSRVLGCPERRRSNDQIATVIMEQARGRTSLNIRCWTHCLIVEDQKIITVLGYMMRPKKRRSVGYATEKGVTKMQIKETTQGLAADGDRPSIHGKMMGKALALMADLGRRDAPMPIPDMCLTCAFRDGSMPNMTAGTGIMALNCVLRIDPDRFACHHGMKEGEPQRLCSGYIAAMLAPFSEIKEILTAFYEELAAIEERHDEVRTAFDKWLNHVDPERRLDVYQAAREYAKSEISEMQPPEEITEIMDESGFSAGFGVGPRT